MNLNKKLVLLMQQHNIPNLRQLSQISNIPYMTLKDIMDKDIDIKLSTANKLCQFFKISLNELFNNEVYLDSETNKTIEKDTNSQFQSFDTSNLNSADIKNVKKYIDFLKYSKKIENKNKLKNNIYS